VTAARYGDRTAVVDERGTVTFAELDARADSIARGFTQSGINAGDSVGVLCRNHRYIVEVGGALAKVGAHAVYLNTGFASHQLQSVYEREGAVAPSMTRSSSKPLSARHRGGSSQGRFGDITTPTLDHLAALHAYGERLDRPEHPSIRHPHVGMTGVPKGARRDWPRAARRRSLLDCIPRPHATMVVAAPIFTAWARPMR
jgi:fatty-acyl-CoA synthase